MLISLAAVLLTLWICLFLDNFAFREETFVRLSPPYAANLRGGADGRAWKLRLDAVSDYPDVEDAETVLSLARMCANAYNRRGSPHWLNDTESEEGDSDDGLEHVGGEEEDHLDGFGWGRSGLRGHVYGNADKSVVVIALKGTSTLLQGGGTVARDRLVDNLMFSCCCAAVDLSWSPVCQCHNPHKSNDHHQTNNHKDKIIPDNHNIDMKNGRPCDKRCIKEAIMSNRDGSYLDEAAAITQQVRMQYPTSRIIFTGHSLGAALASLMTRKLAQDDGVVGAVTFACPGDNLYAERLGLAPLEDFRRITHFGLTSDPIYMGTCRGRTSSCYLGGYAMESKCRVGRECHWLVRRGPTQDYNINTHRMHFYIQQVLAKWRLGSIPAPTCRPAPVDCRDCPEWSFL